MREFIASAKDTIGEVDEDDVITFEHHGREVTFFQPSTGQQAMMLSMGGRDMNLKAAGVFIQLFFEMMDDETQRYFQSRLMDRKDAFDINSDGGIFDIWEALVEEWSARPTKEPSDYQPPRRATGKTSTGSTRVRASTSSRSRSTGSSQ